MTAIAFGNTGSTADWAALDLSLYPNLTGVDTTVNAQLMVTDEQTLVYSDLKFTTAAGLNAFITALGSKLSVTQAIEFEGATSEWAAIALTNVPALEGVDTDTGARVVMMGSGGGARLAYTDLSFVDVMSVTLWFTAIKNLLIDGQILRQFGYSAKGDMTAQDLRFDASSTAAVVAGLVIGSGTGRLIAHNWRESGGDPRCCGAVFDNTTDSKDALVAAVAYMAAIGGGKITLPDGFAKTSGNIPAGANVTIEGQGMGVSGIRASAGGFTIISGSVIGSFALKHLTLWGYGDTDNTADSLRRLANVTTTEDLLYDHVEGQYSRDMSLTGKAGGVATAIYCKVHDGHRDGINLTGSKKTIVNFCECYKLGDDAIAIHGDSSYTGVDLTWKEVIGNRYERCLGIKVLGMNRGVIADNVTDLVFGYGLYIGQDAGEGKTTQRSWIVHSNQIGNVVNASKLGLGSLNSSIYVAAPNATAGSGDYAVGVSRFALTGSVSDGEEVVLDDVTYEFDTDASVTGGNVLVDVSGGATASEAIAALLMAHASNIPTDAIMLSGPGNTIDAYSSSATGVGAASTTTCANGSWTNATLTATTAGPGEFDDTNDMFIRPEYSFNYRHMLRY